ncbi:AAA family ATPase [Vibrio parahaemolyticus]|uniref:AAA family ATPase n=1 Tax=Vibrio parahaemolyticus TaxID=670 RepID=UPI0006A65647|nr:AAA family ATPase [Vibrio parahaemolyticus]KOE91495.1 hypothetical protein ACS88_23700 [Vibrio parahaemolyticus]
MNNSPSLIVRKLTVLGTRKNYEIEFDSGINIIWGDLDCGKSSILSLISYCLGASSLDSYDELEESARSARLTVEINDDTYIFERELFNSKQYIKGYRGVVNPDIAPIILSPDLNGDAPDGYISFFIMDLLGLPITKVKISPSKTDSTMHRVGFKDLLKFLYLKQKDIASDSLLNMNERYRYVKHKEIMKFLFNIHNQNISEIEAAIAKQQEKLNEKKREYNEITKFLNRVNFDFSIDFEKKEEENNDAVKMLDSQVSLLKKDYKKASGMTKEIECRLQKYSNLIEESQRKNKDYNTDLASYLKLRNSYLEERRSISTSIKVESTFHSIHSTEIKCPLCNIPQNREVEKSRIPVSILSSEKKSLDRKIRSLNSLIDEVRENIDSNAKKIEQARHGIEEIQYSFDTKYAKEVSEIVESISLLEKQKVDLLSNKKILARDRSIVNRLDIISVEMNNIEKVMRRLNVDLINAKENSEDSETVVGRLSQEFNMYMSNSLLNNVESSMVDDRLDYLVRNKFFTELTSGGVRTITSLGIYLSKLLYSLKNNSNFPTFMMIDTPGNNIGRYRSQDVSNDDVSSDQKVYERVYEQLLSIAEYANKEGRNYQIIVVDNDLAVTARERKDIFHVSKRFSKSKPEFDYGLINDYLD